MYARATPGGSACGDAELPRGFRVVFREYDSKLLGSREYDLFPSRIPHRTTRLQCLRFVFAEILTLLNAASLGGGRFGRDASGVRAAQAVACSPAMLLPISLRRECARCAQATRAFNSISSFFCEHQ